jgi:hypothetical protein
MAVTQRIVQIIPAQGWLALYEQGTGDVQDLRTRAVVCWALVEESAGEGPASTRVVGLDAEGVAGKQARGTFIAYVREGEKLDRFRKDGG